MKSMEIILIDGINKCIVNLKDIEEFDSRLQQYNAILENIGFELQDLSRDIKIFGKHRNRRRKTRVFRRKNRYDKWVKENTVILLSRYWNIGNP